MILTIATMIPYQLCRECDAKLHKPLGRHEHAWASLWEIPARQCDVGQLLKLPHLAVLRTYPGAAYHSSQPVGHTRQDLY